MSSPAASTSTAVLPAPGNEPNKIKSGDLVLFRLPRGDVKGIKVVKGSNVAIPRVGSVTADDLIGQPYGLTYEIQQKNLKTLPPKTLQEVEDTDATNELINDGEFVQPLTFNEIQALRQSGVHASEIIKKQIEQHSNYELKTEYSKEKYKKRKEAKYSKTFTTVEPTLYNVCEYWFEKDQSRIRDLRPDTLSQLLNHANVGPGGRYLVVDDASGLIVAAMLSRMGGEGRVMTICDTDSPPAYPVMNNMNFNPNFVNGVLLSLNWATADEDYVPIVPPSELPSDEIKSDRQKSRLRKRKGINDALNSTREELFAGEFDALIVACDYEPFSITERLFPYLSGSAAIVVQSPYIQYLTDLQNKMRPLPQYLSPTVTESWIRRYQVLPGRTHPMMTTAGSGSYLLHTIKIFDDPTASSVLAHRRKDNKKRKIEEALPAPIVQEPEQITMQVQEKSLEGDIVMQPVTGS